MVGEKDLPVSGDRPSAEDRHPEEVPAGGVNGRRVVHAGGAEVFRHLAGRPFVALLEEEDVRRVHPIRAQGRSDVSGGIAEADIERDHGEAVPGRGRGRSNGSTGALPREDRPFRVQEVSSRTSPHDQEQTGEDRDQEAEDDDGGSVFERHNMSRSEGTPPRRPPRAWRPARGVARCLDRSRPCCL